MNCWSCTGLPTSRRRSTSINRAQHSLATLVLLFKAQLRQHIYNNENGNVFQLLSFFSGVLLNNATNVKICKTMQLSTIFNCYCWRRQYYSWAFHEMLMGGKANGTQQRNISRQPVFRKLSTICVSCWYCSVSCWHYTLWRCIKRCNWYSKFVLEIDANLLLVLGLHKANRYSAQRQQHVLVSSRECRVVATDLLDVNVTLWLNKQFSSRVAVGDRRQAGDILKHWLIFHFHLLTLMSRNASYRAL